MKKLSTYLIFAVLLLMIVSCTAPGCNEISISDEEKYGFLFGIWHGVIFPFMLIGKIFGADVGLFAELNSGALYHIGFLIGIGAVFGGGGAASRHY